MAAASTAGCTTRSRRGVLRPRARAQGRHPVHARTTLQGPAHAAIEDPDPVLFFEHKSTYRLIKGEVPDGASSPDRHGRRQARGRGHHGRHLRAPATSQGQGRCRSRSCSDTCAASQRTSRLSPTAAGHRVYADDAVRELRRRGRRARRLVDGFPEWRRAGLPVELDPEATGAAR